MLEEYARAQIAAEEAHVADIGKMLRKARFHQLTVDRPLPKG